MAPPAATVLCQASVSYKKRPGYLFLTATTLSWSTSASSSSSSTSTPPDLVVPSSSLRTLFSSKEGGAKVMLKVGVTSSSSSATEDSKEPEEEHHNFTFISASSAISDREHFKKELSSQIANNRAQPLASTSGSSTPSTSTHIKSEKPSIGTPGGGGGGVGGVTSLQQLKIRLLQDSPALNSLFQSLVIQQRTLSEQEFWAGREPLLQQLEAEDKLQRGKSGRMVDPKPETGDGGVVTVKVTPALIREIFEEYPEVLRAYSENVPVPLDSQQFWTRYFQSKLFNRNRSTNRAAVSAVKDDDIFDRYLGEEDDDIEPRKMEQHDVDLSIDLRATEEDQHEVTNRPDMTMRAGGQRASLPLMRRFNEHSERLLNQALGKEPHRVALGLNPGNAGLRNETYSSILIEDLQDPSNEDRILLKMDNKNPSSRSGATGSSSEHSNTELELLGVDERREVVERVKGSVENWEGRLDLVEMDFESVELAVDDMTLFIQSKVDRTSRGDSSNKSLSDSLLSKLITIQAASNELLRQFWLAALPPKLGMPIMSPEEKRKKVERFRGYLGGTEEKCKKVLEECRGEGERKRAGEALKPVREAVAFALKYNAG